MLTLRYLGVAGWQFQTARHSLLIDPYFTRLPMRRVLLGRAIPDTRLIAQHTPPAQWIFATHPHYDHLMDIPEAARITRAHVYASPQGCALLKVLGVPPAQICPIYAGDTVSVGDFTVSVFESQHRRIFGDIPYVGPLNLNLQPPLRARDYRMDHQYSFLLTAEGVRVLITSGIDSEPAEEADILLVGADGTRDQLAAILNATKPHTVLPTHWDDMFRPLSKPPRPMYIPPKHRIPSPRRLDLAAFARMVEEIKPGTRVILPRYFEEIKF